MLTGRCLAFAFMLTAGPAAQAAMPPLTPPRLDNGDLRCLIVTAKTASTLSAEEQALWQVGVVYFWGRIDGQSPDLDFKAALFAEMEAMTPDKFDAEMKRCGDELKARAAVMKDISAALQDYGK